MVVMALVGASCTPAPDDGEFYSDVFAALGEANPGALLRYKSNVFSLDPFFHTPVAGVKSWKVLYKSTRWDGSETQVSGTVLVPAGEWRGDGPRPIVSFAVGTRGLNDRCAPSRTLETGWDYEGGTIKAALAQGWAVVVTDMVGLGTPGTHSYVVGGDQGHAVLDIVRAAIHLEEAELDPEAPVALWGYSQGGGTASWGAQFAPEYAPELNLVAVAASGVPADFEKALRRMDGGIFFGLVMLGAVGLDAAYPELNLEDFLNHRGQELLENREALCVVDLRGLQLFADASFKWVNAYVDVNPLETPAWRARLEENRLGKVAPEVPVLLQHGTADQVVPVGQARELRDQWCEGGATVEWREYPLAEHVFGFIMSAQPAMQFIDAQFKGQPPRSSC